VTKPRTIWWIRHAAWVDEEFMQHFCFKDWKVEKTWKSWKMLEDNIKVDLEIIGVRSCGLNWLA
jgi:hypothetical protein